MLKGESAINSSEEDADLYIKAKRLIGVVESGISNLGQNHREYFMNNKRTPTQLKEKVMKSMPQFLETLGLDEDGIIDRCRSGDRYIYAGINLMVIGLRPGKDDRMQ